MDIDYFADVHSHILPAVDDGAQTMEEACRMIDMAYREGIRIIVLTPHHHPRRGNVELSHLNKKLQELRTRISRTETEMRIFFGMEVYFQEDILKELDEKKLKSMGKSNCILLEFSQSDTFFYIRCSIQKVQMKGYQVILAHVERYACMLENWTCIEELLGMGVYIQINSGSIMGENGAKEKRYVRKLLKNRYVHLVGTDAHDTNRRKPEMRKAADYVERKCGRKYAELIFYKNAVSMLKCMELER